MPFWMFRKKKKVIKVAYLFWKCYMLIHHAQ
jgi:hypothetical protein